MATIQPIYGHQIVVKIGDGGNPETFAAPALINTSRGVNFSTSAETDELMDVADPSAPAITVRRIRANDTSIDGAGMVHKPDLEEWLEWATTGVAKNVEVSIGGEGGPTVRGPFLLTSFQISGERVKTVEVQVTLEQADKVAVV